MMRHTGINGTMGNPRCKSKQQVPTASGLVERQFARSAPNEPWLTDATEHRTREGRISRAVAMDTYSRRVVGWSVDASPDTVLVTNRLVMAISDRGPSA